MAVQQKTIPYQILEELYCPVLHEPLTEAVSLPCAHKVQQSVAETLYGKLTPTGIVEKHGKCPLCKVDVNTYAVDTTIRNIVQKLFSLSEEHKQELTAQIGIKYRELQLLQKSKEVPHPNIPKKPYPGKPAKFVLEDNTWKYNGCRVVAFKSLTDSLIKRFTLLGYKNGSIAIQISLFSERLPPDVFNYFQIIDPDFQNYAHTFKKSDYVRIIFNILSENNEIPAPYFEKIRAMVEAGCYDPQQNPW